MIDVSSSNIDGVLEIIPTLHEDYRGTYVETWNRDLYASHGIEVGFIQDDVSTSRRGVIRGLHGDHKTWKLVCCLLGEIYLVILDCRDGSPTEGKWQNFMITRANRRQVLVPPGCAVGHLALSEEVFFHYKQSTNYDPDGQFTILWDDPKHAIHWPVSDPVLSPRDAGMTDHKKG